MAETEKGDPCGGCFWGVQDLIRKLDGVVSTRELGYTGGDAPNATIPTTARMPRRSASTTFDPDVSPTGTCWSASSTSLLDLRRTVRATMLQELSVGD